MVPLIQNNTQSLKGKLALFFTLLSLIFVLITALSFDLALHWSEDRAGERRILLDRQPAISRFIAGEQGILKIDQLTTAYNDLTLVPQPYRAELEGKATYLGEAGDEPDSRMIYLGEYSNKGQAYPLILLTEVDRIELSNEEIVLAITFVIALFTALLAIFGTLLWKLYRKLIEPLGTLSEQLATHGGDTEQCFHISHDSAIEFKQLADRLNLYRTQIKKVVKREQAFARYASHELKTPLTVIRGAVSLLNRSELAPFQQKQVNRTNEASQQMKEITDALLALVKYERAPEDAELRTIEQAELDAIIHLNTPQANEKGVEITLHCIDQPQTQANDAVINMVVGNLLRNAIAASQPDTTIHITLSHDSLSIRDQGVGLDASPSQQGHGLGLLIIDDLCSRYGWQFELNSLPAGGCEARVLF